jgi:sulfide:quinone oxidoreductase
LGYIQQGRRKNVKIIFNSSLPSIFGVEKYAKALQKVVDRKEIEVNYRHNLVEVQAKERVAIFQNLDTQKLVHFQVRL